MWVLCWFLFFYVCRRLRSFSSALLPPQWGVISFKCSPGFHLLFCGTPPGGTVGCQSHPSMSHWQTLQHSTKYTYPLEPMFGVKMEFCYKNWIVKYLNCQSLWMYRCLTYTPVLTGTSDALTSALEVLKELLAWITSVLSCKCVSCCCKYAFQVSEKNGKGVGKTQ